MAKRWKSVVVCVLGVLMLTGAIGCSGQPLTTREKGTLAGGGWGAANQQREIERQRREIAHLQQEHVWTCSGENMCHAQ